jgi:hypothetical protein
MKNIHILPTDKPSRLFLTENTLLLNNQYTLQEIFPKGKCQNIYITSDEEIKEGDYTYHEVLGIGLIVNISGEDCFVTLKTKPTDGSVITPWKRNVPDIEKIILTTDFDLIKDGVQAIDDEFLQWFVNNPSCENIEVADLWKDGNPSTHDMYQIIIPQKEPKNSYLPNSCDIIFETASLIDDGKESLEEAAEKYRDYWLETKGLTLTDTFIAGAKWQAERMYSEEEVKKLFNRYNEFIAHHDIEEWQTWINKQFKKN